MRRILLIIPYFGSLNAKGYFAYFLRTCAGNPTVDFLLLTDDRTPYAYPPNVRVVPATLAALKRRFAARLGVPVRLEQPYKLCDFRLAYGMLFREEIEGYDLWGFADTDLLLGDLRAFLPDQLLDAYGRIFTHGHLSLFSRSVPADFFQLPIPGMPTWQEVLSSGRSYAFDEWINQNDAYNTLDRLGLRTYRDKPFFDMVPPGRAGPFGFVRGCPKERPEIAAYEREMSDTAFYYAEGKLYRIGLRNGVEIVKTEILYAHFQQRSFRAAGAEAAERFVIAPNYISPCRACPADRKTIRRLQFDASRYAPLAHMARRKLLRTLGK